jgi:hypothetical protein
VLAVLPLKNSQNLFIYCFQLKLHPWSGDEWRTQCMIGGHHAVWDAVHHV